MEADKRQCQKGKKLRVSLTYCSIKQVEGWSLRRIQCILQSEQTETKTFFRDKLFHDLIFFEIFTKCFNRYLFLPYMRRKTADHFRRLLPPLLSAIVAINSAHNSCRVCAVVVVGEYVVHKRSTWLRLRFDRHRAFDFRCLWLVLLNHRQTNNAKLIV